jgi:16S rRNA (cytosine1402-N4)-methyltransferase
MIHVPVLLQEVIDGLLIEDGDIVVDGTLGNAGHSKALLALGKNIRIIGIDKDEDALSRSKKLLEEDSRMTFVQGSYANLDAILDNLGISKINKAIFDFGFSSDQIETSGRGFSFQKDEPLLMTYEKNPDESTVTAHDIVNLWEEDTIRTIIRNYGEERFAGRIAKAIVRARELNPITTTSELVEIIRAATPAAYGRGKIHPATRTFQALRIAVNDELTVVLEGLEAAFRRLAIGGRIAAISFHSHEDRIVKHHFKSWVAVGSAQAITKKPITPKMEEVAINNRSRSAKLRIIEKSTQ